MRTLQAARVLLVASLALVALPHAAAQIPGLVPPQFSLFAEDPGRAFLPGATEAVQVVVNYGPGQGGRPAPAPTAERPENTQPTRVTFALKTQPSWVTDVRFEPAELYFMIGVENATATTQARRANVLLNVSPDAPALQRESFVVVATADPNGNIAGATAESPELKLRATVVGKLNVTAAEPTTIIPGGRWTTLQYTVRNEGNSDIVAKINVTVRPENSQVEFNETLELKVGETRVVDVRLRTPWIAAEFGEMELEAVPIVDGEEGTPARALVAVRGESAVPLPLGALLGGLLVVAALRRRAA